MSNITVVKQKEAPGLVDAWNAQYDTDPALLDALKKIARGRSDCGRPLGGSAAQQVVRQALVACGVDW